MKVLNLYAGIGGNRELWEDCQVTAVEIDLEIANLYKVRFPQDEVVVGDAHQYLLEHFKEFDFIWSSPPCPTHSRTNFFLKGKGIMRYPDMRLYQEIIFLQTHCKAKWLVENVIGYYDPLIKPQQAGRHYLWANFNIAAIKLPKDEIGRMNGLGKQKANKIPIAKRNAVNPELGLHVMRCAFKIRQEVLA
jgi:DNA (cytosine-5)-methyltransferase 1